jgi:hypothetical protein
MTDEFDAWVDDALGLFPPGEAQLPAPPTPSGVWGALNTKWTRYKGVHKPCDACTELIHQLGAGKAPHPQATAWKRAGPNGDRFLCNAHGEEHKRLDAQVAAEHAQRTQHAEHHAKANRSRGS